MEGTPASDSQSVLVRWMGVLDAHTAGNVHGGTIMKLCDGRRELSPAAERLGRPLRDRSR